jgi:hypothetical protein
MNNHRTGNKNKRLASKNVTYNTDYLAKNPQKYQDISNIGHRLNDESSTTSINPKQSFVTRTELKGYFKKVMNGKEQGKEEPIDISSSDYRLIGELTKVMKVKTRQKSKSKKSKRYTVYPHIKVMQSNETSQVKIFIRDIVNRNNYEVNLSSVLQSLKDKEMMNYIDKALKVTMKKGN